MKGFYHGRGSWYGEHLKGCEDYVGFGNMGWEEYEEEYAYKNEVIMEWNKIDGELVSKLQIYDEDFEVLGEEDYQKVIKKLGEYDSITPLEFKELLKEFGFKDMTEYEEPKFDIKDIY